MVCLSPIVSRRFGMQLHIETVCHVEAKWTNAKKTLVPTHTHTHTNTNYYLINKFAQISCIRFLVLQPCWCILYFYYVYDVRTFILFVLCAWFSCFFLFYVIMYCFKLGNANTKEFFCFFSHSFSAHQKLSISISFIHAYSLWLICIPAFACVWAHQRNNK